MTMLDFNFQKDSRGSAALGVSMQSREITKQIRMANKVAIALGLRLGRTEVLRILKLSLWAQSQGHHTANTLKECGGEEDSCLRSSWRGMGLTIANQTFIRCASKTTTGERPKRDAAHMGFSLA